MPRRVMLMMALVMVAAAAVIELRHLNRASFARLQQQVAERDALEIEWSKLLLEEGAWSQHRRIEQVARVRLEMAQPNLDKVHVVNLVRSEAGR